MRSSLPLTIARMTEVGGIAMYGVHTPIDARGPLRMQHRHRPRDEAAPIVSDEDRALDLQRIEQSHHVSRQLGKSVVGDRGRRTRIRIAALIGRDRAKPAAATAGN